MKQPGKPSKKRHIIHLLSKYNLIDVNGKVGDADCMIRLYASLQFALDTEEFKKFVISTEKRMMAKEGAETEDMEEDAEDDAE